MCIRDRGALERLDLKARQTIAIFGMGPVGLSAVMLANKMGSKVIAIDINKKRLNRRLKNLEQLTEDDLFSWIMNSKTSLYDPHSSYMSPRVTEDFEINMSLSLEGIGAMLTSDDGITKITKLIKGGPAIKSGLIKNNDQIVGVGTREDSQIVDVRDWRVDEVVKLISGPKGTKLKLEILYMN